MVVKVDTHALVPKCRVDLLPGVACVVGGIVDEHLHGPQGPGHLGDHLLVPGQLADVSVHIQGPGRTGAGDGLH